MEENGLKVRWKKMDNDQINFGILQLTKLARCDVNRENIDACNSCIYGSECAGALAGIEALKILRGEISKMSIERKGI